MQFNKSAVDRLGFIASTIRSEVIEHNDMLDTLDQDIDEADERMGSTMKKITKLLGTSDKGRLCCIFWLIVINVILIVILIFFWLFWSWEISFHQTNPSVPYHEHPVPVLHVCVYKFIYFPHLSMHACVFVYSLVVTMMLFVISLSRVCSYLVDREAMSFSNCSGSVMTASCITAFVYLCMCATLSPRMLIMQLTHVFTCALSRVLLPQS